METLAGNDDDDNSSSGTKGQRGCWFPGRIRLASTRSSRARNAIDMRKPRIRMARSFAQSDAFIIVLDLITCTTNVL